MEEIRDYYAFLGVPRNAMADEIKRAYARKRREYQNDETKSTQLNQAYEVLCDSAKRKQYDLNMRYGNQVEDIKEKIRNSETLEQRDKHLVDAKKIYLDIIKTDAENVDALWNLVGIEELLGNDTQAMQYLKQLEKCVEGDDKLQVYHRLGEIYRRLGKVDEAIKCYHAIYKADAACVEDIKILVRLCYEDKKDLKAAIQILNDCINRSADSRLKIVYLYETLRAIRLLKVSSYQKVEDTVYKKLETFHTNNEEGNLANAATVLTCFEDIIDREDFECFHRMEQVYLAYGVKYAELNQIFKAVQQIVSLMEKGKVHKAIDLYLEEQWTKEIREQIGKLIIMDAEKIKASLESIKKEAPEYWKSGTKLADLEKLVNENLRTSKEFILLSNDRTISHYMKKMMECILLDGFVAFEDMKDEFIEARDSFFDKEDRGKFEHTLRKMEEYYPLCYRLFADIFFEGKSTEALSKGNKQDSNSGNVQSNVVAKELPFFPNAEEGYEHKPYISGLLELLVLIVVFCCFPPAIPIIFAMKYYSRHKKTLDKVWKILKPICIMGIMICIGVAVLKVGSSIKEMIELKKEEEYLENHDFFLTDEELEKRNELEERYNRKTDVNIHVMQANPYNEVDYPDENYIWLMIWNYGYNASCELISNYLSTDEKIALMQELSVLYSDDYTDFEKCEKIYELAYAYIVEHEENIVEVPSLLGLTLVQAEQLLENNNLHISIENYEYSSEYAVDTIMSQYPEVGTELEKGQEIYVGISMGVDNRIETPLLIGKSYDEIKNSGLQLTVLEQDYSDVYAEGIIMEQNIPEGTKLNDGESIGVVISLGEKLPANISADEYFDLQRFVASTDSISYESILEMIGVNPALCTKTASNVITFPALFMGVEGTTTLEISYLSEEQPYVNIEWLSAGELSVFDMWDLLYEQGYTEVLEQRYNSWVYDGCESENGRVRTFRRSVNRQERCLLKFVAY